ncbi:MAG TPA: TolC family protein [Bacteroidales bacterium]|jgi:outer membrane protein|nr:TolC family protein [Bacteroidales bacterium]
MKKLITIFLLLLSAANISGYSISSFQQDSVWTLEKCIDYALEKNIQVRKSELSNRTSVLYAEQATAQRFPSLGASVNQNFDWSRNNGSALRSSNGTSYSINSGVTLFNYSRITNLIRQANLDIQSGNYSLEATKESISLNILNAFLQVLYAEEQVNNSRKQIESTESQLNLAGERLALQVISQADYAQVKSQLASEKLTLANSESQLAIAKVNLMQLMELPVTADFNISHPDLGETVNQNRIPDVSKVYETALAIKPQIRAAEVNKEIASLDDNIARAAYFPVLSANAGVSTSYADRTADPYFTQLNDYLRPGIGLSLSVPIYQKKQAKTNVAVAKINYENAELSEIDTRNQLRKDIEQACQDVISAQIEYVASSEKYQATLESSALSEEKFTQGIINSVDYLVSKTNLIVSESQLLQSKYNLIFSYKVLDFYMGIPFSL